MSEQMREGRDPLTWHGRVKSGRVLGAPQPERRKAPRGVLPGLIVIAALLAALVIFSPKEPQQRAYYTAGTGSGLVSDLADENGVVSVADPRYRGLRISEIMPSNQTAVPDENGAFPDWVEVWNAGAAAVNMSGVGLSDKGNSIRFLFPAVTLQPDERVIVFCDGTNQVDTTRPFHAKFSLSSVGETVYLYDPNAYLIDSVTYHILGSDTSWALTDTGWQEVTFFSPGYENSLAGHEAYRADTMVLGGAIIINEVMPDAKSGFMDEDGEFSDWIELYNTTDQTIALANYALSDKENRPTKWRFPDGAVIAPHGYYMVFCSGKDRRDDPTAIPHTNFRISAEQDTVLLADSRGRIVDRAMIDNIPEDCSWARDPNGVFSIHTFATPARDNDDITGADQDMRRRNSLGVYITEVMASNDQTDIGNGYVDWVELHNATGQAVSLAGCGLSDNIGRPRRWQFPAGAVIQPGEYLLVFCDGKAEKTSGTAYHTNFKVRRAGGETICLSTPEGRVVDKLVLPTIPTDVSYGRTLGTTGFFYYAAATPRAANGDGFRGYAENPVFSVGGGLYYSTVAVTMTVPRDCTVYYTTDGSVPTPTRGTAYHGETLEFSYTTVLRARAISSTDLKPSDIITATYFVNIYHTMPVVSLVGDPEQLWNQTDGMLADGPNIDKSGGIKFKNAVYREFGKLWREGYLEYYDTDGTQLLSQGMEFGLMGDYSLDMPQKSFKIKAKAAYGAKTFAAPLFEDRPYTEYKSIVLRNSGNDSMFTRLLDGFNSRLLDAYGTIVIHQAWKPVVVYLNGQYWGHMNLRQRNDRFFIAQFEGIPLDEASEMTILEHSAALKYGSSAVRKEYRNMIAEIKKGDPASNPADLQYILDNVDVDNYLEYIALEMFIGNSDIGNTAWYRLNREGSKWKWIFYDADYGFFTYTFKSPWSFTKAKGMGQMNMDNTILRKLLTVPEYKDKFLSKLGDIFQFFTVERMLGILEPLVAQIQPEMTLHWSRWGPLNDKAVISEVPTTADGAYRYWEKRVERLRNTIRCRPHFLWQYIKDGFKENGFPISDEEMLHYFGPQPELPPEALP